MFKFAKTGDIKTLYSLPQQFIETNSDDISKHCRIESWHADLSTGFFTLGPAARQLHGFTNDTVEIGLLNLIQLYDSKDQAHILELYELAAMGPSSFCFCTTLNAGDGSCVAMTCIGESSNFSDNGEGSLNGVLVFPTFRLNDGSQQNLQVVTNNEITRIN